MKMQTRDMRHETRGRRGQAIVEYLVVVGVVIAALIGAASLAAPRVSDVMDSAVETIPGGK